MNMVVIAVRVVMIMGMFMNVLMRRLMTLVVMMFGVGVVVIGVVRVALFGVRIFRVQILKLFLPLIGLGDLRGVDAGVFHDLALDAFAVAAAAGVAMART